MQVGNERLNILPKSSQARKKATTSPSQVIHLILMAGNEGIQLKKYNKEDCSTTTLTIPEAVLVSHAEQGNIEGSL